MSGPDEVRQRAAEAASRARQHVRRVAVEVFGAVTVEEPVHGFRVLTRTQLDDPLLGVRAALLLFEVAAGQMRGWALEARGAGRSWAEVAGALELDEQDEDDGPPDQVAWEWLIEHRPPHPSRRYRFEPASTVWTCTTCRARVRDTGPFASHPDDREQGHAPGCARHAAAIARWRAGLDDDGHDKRDDEGGAVVGDDEDDATEHGDTEDDITENADGLVAPDELRGCETCRVIGPLLTEEGTSGRSWRCDTCGESWSARPEGGQQR